jgi:hypothetical protein
MDPPVGHIEAKRIQVAALKAALTFGKHIESLGFVSLDGDNRLQEHRLGFVGRAELAAVLRERCGCSARTGTDAAAIVILRTTELEWPLVCISSELICRSYRRLPTSCGGPLGHSDQRNSILGMAGCRVPRRS